MSPERRRSIGRVGKPHGIDGTFHVEDAAHALSLGTLVWVSGRQARVERRAGSEQSPLVRVGGVSSREAAADLRGAELAVTLGDAPLEEGEWLTEDLVGCTVDGLGRVRRVIAAPSCDLLEVGEGCVLVPFIRDAIRSVDPVSRRIEVDRRFLGLPPTVRDAPAG